MFFGIQYVYNLSTDFANKIKSVWEKHYLFCKFIPYFKKNKTLLSYFSNYYKKYKHDANTGVYSIPCADCNLLYIGQTGRNLSLRLKEHKYSIKSDRSSALSEHSSTGHFVNFNGAKFIHYENDLSKRLIAESLLLKNKQVLPNNTPSFELRVFT